MNTFKAVHSSSGASLQSLGFALSSADIVSALEKKFPNSSPAKSLTAGQLAQINIKSNAADGEIYIDGKFVGNVGSTISLPVGDHSIEVRATKYQTWQKTIAVSGPDSVNVNATPWFRSKFRSGGIRSSTHMRRMTHISTAHNDRVPIPSRFAKSGMQPTKQLDFN
jgi:hypothetical protein